MLFHVTWEFIDTTEAGIRRRVAVFPQWQLPDGAELTAFYNFADNSGGVAIIEVDSAATLARATAPWVPLLRFTSKPIIPVEESIAIAGGALAFLDSVS